MYFKVAILFLTFITVFKDIKRKLSPGVGIEKQSNKKKNLKVVAANGGPKQLSLSKFFSTSKQATKTKSKNT